MATAAVQQIIDQMRGMVSAGSGFAGILKLDFGDAGSVLIDGKSKSITDGDGKTADCTISVALDTYEKLSKQELDPTSAFMQGKLRVAGDMGIAMKLGPMLQKPRS